MIKSKTYVVLTEKSCRVITGPHKDAFIFCEALASPVKGVFLFLDHNNKIAPLNVWGKSETVQDPARLLCNIHNYDMAII